MYRRFGDGGVVLRKGFKDFYNTRNVAQGRRPHLDHSSCMRPDSVASDDIVLSHG